MTTLLTEPSHTRSRRYARGERSPASRALRLAKAPLADLMRGRTRSAGSGSGPRLPLRDRERARGPLRGGLRVLRAVDAARGAHAGASDAERENAPRAARKARAWAPFVSGSSPAAARRPQTRAGSRAVRAIRHNGPVRPLRLPRRAPGGGMRGARRGPRALPPQSRDVRALLPLDLRHAPMGGPRADGADGETGGARGLRGGIFGPGDVGRPGGPRPRPAGTRGRIGPGQFPDARRRHAARKEASAPAARALRIIALFRFVLPRAEIRVAGEGPRSGRRRRGSSRRGANGMMVGDYLTTRGRGIGDDRRMLERLGLGGRAGRLVGAAEEGEESSFSRGVSRIFADACRGLSIRSEQMTSSSAPLLGGVHHEKEGRAGDGGVARARGGDRRGVRGRAGARR